MLWLPTNQISRRPFCTQQLRIHLESSKLIEASRPLIHFYLEYIPASTHNGNHERLSIPDTLRAEWRACYSCIKRAASQRLPFKRRPITSNIPVLTFTSTFLSRIRPLDRWKTVLVLELPVQSCRQTIVVFIVSSSCLISESHAHHRKDQPRPQCRTQPQLVLEAGKHSSFSLNSSTSSKCSSRSQGVILRYHEYSILIYSQRYEACMIRHGPTSIFTINNRHHLDISNAHTFLNSNNMIDKFICCFTPFLFRQTRFYSARHLILRTALCTKQIPIYQSCASLPAKNLKQD